MANCSQALGHDTQQPFQRPLTKPVPVLQYKHLLTSSTVYHLPQRTHAAVSVFGEHLHAMQKQFTSSTAAPRPRSAVRLDAYADGHPADGAGGQPLPAGAARLVAALEHQPLARLPAHGAQQVALRHRLHA